MKIAHECAGCLIAFLDNVSGRLTLDEAERLQILQEAASVLSGHLLVKGQPQVSTEASTAIWRQVVVPRNPDPFAEEKRISNELALALLPSMRQLVAEAPSLEAKLALAMKLALVGNYIDLHAVFHTGAEASEEFISSLLAHLDDPLGVDDTDVAVEALKSAGRILYHFDNAGEIVFDIPLIDLFIEQGRQVVGVVKLPFANNATIEDARQVGLAPRIPVVSTDNNTDGIPQDFVTSCNVHFVRLFKEPGWLKIMKGMSLYESTTEPAFDEFGPYVHLLKLKCERILRDVEARCARSPQLLDSVIWLRK